MTDPRHEPGANEKLVQAYNRMLERIKTALEHAEQDALPTLQQNIEAAKKKAVALGELTREEAEKIGAYLKRDLHDAAEYLRATRQELSDWLRFDLGLLEDRIAEMFALMVDRTRLELDRLALHAQTPSDQQQWHTGEITGIGTLRCTACKQTMQFHAAGRIPPCPKCHTTSFRRVTRGDK